MARALALVLLPAALAGCPSKKKESAPTPVSSAPAPSATPPPAPPPGPKPSEKAARDLADVKAAIAKDAKTKKPGNDVQVICDGLENERATATDPEHVAVLDEAHELCTFDVPLYVAGEALDQLAKSTSPASVL